MKRKAAILGIKGTRLSSDEKHLLKKEKPWGIIIFSRNVKSICQLKNLILEIKKIFNDKNYPILIDQEGGRVSRLNKIVDFTLFSQGFFGKLFNENQKNFLNRYKIYIDRVSDILNEVGININTVPVLDVLSNYTHSIIGNRSFSKNHKNVSRIGNLCINLYKENKIATVIKHIPGHGLSKEDSHKKMPLITTKEKYLLKKNFYPFTKSKSLFAMTAHVVYKYYDPVNTVTHSSIIINDVIRKEIGFKGILISDDINMKALKCGLKNNIFKALDAGCNLILHCNANINEMREVMKTTPFIDSFTQKKTSHFYNFLG